MNELKERKIRFSDAAFAIGVTNKALRNWLQRNPMKLVSDYEGPGWTEFTLADIAVLAVTERIVKFGFQVSFANALAYDAIFKHAGLMLAQADMASDTFASVLELWEIEIWYNGIGNSEHRIRNNVKPASRPADTYLALNIGKVVATAFKRLKTDDIDDETVLYNGLLKLRHTIASMTDDIRSDSDDT